ncbi:ROK family protein [Acholeplasma laidlawii]|uniref:ROK family protein n=1 Tax=Acholeplasma laidlawii TaxID=2148 RepID=UPI0018C31EDE|nr:ROK family protein [Acholeplasma laidlawii]MBG0762545.1 ROK family protein [Acholeplasma laidlawii]
MALNNKLKLDPTYEPAIIYFNEFKEEVKKSNNFEPLTVVVERMDGFNESYTANIFKDPSKLDKNIFFADRLVKTLLWLYGGYKVTIVGNKDVYESIKKTYLEGDRLFDSKFMSRIYGKPFEVVHAVEVPKLVKGDSPIGKHLKGNRIGFDAGGSDMKVSAVVDGVPVFSTEVVWFPKLNSDPNYHKENIRKVIQLAVEQLPSVDALGVSSAGVYIHNEARVASLFIEVPDELFEEHITNIYKDIAKELNVPLEVANDGDVTALAGSMSLGKNKLLGIAMGTSEAVGYINAEGNVTGWLNELAFVPVDFQKNGPIDEWSLDMGTGNKYFSQDAVIRLAETSGITFPEDMPLAERLKVVQNLDENSETYQEIYKTIGTYLGYTLAYYEEFYDIEEVLLLGRVTSGLGGQIIVDVATKTLKENFEHLSKKINISLPDEKARRVGQSVAAASLVKL